MATAEKLVSVEEYLHTSFDDADHEYVDGRIEERNLGELPHAKLQKLLIELLEKRSLFAIQEVRLRVGVTRFRVPDVQAYVEEPKENVFTQPPLLIAEVLSPEDWVSRMFEKFEDYKALGTEHLYLLDPIRKTLRRFDSGDFITVHSLDCGPVRIPEEEIFPKAP